MSDVVILGSENPNAEVLLYDSGRAYNVGKVVDNGGDALLMSDGGTEYKVKFEYVSEAQNG